MINRAGSYALQPGEYAAFIPAPLPPDPPIRIDGELARVLSEADLALGRLDGVASVLPNPNMFVAMYVRQEAVLSSQIEGTQSTLHDVLQFELDAEGSQVPRDVEEVVNYISAMNHGLDRLATLPLSLRLIREIHEVLVSGVRGGDRTPGEFRNVQNWIGPEGCTLRTATFVPPPVSELQSALADFERFLHNTEAYPVLIHSALAHAQFETIHPFMDGNGRVGRLLIALLLCERGVLRLPLLYLSYYLKARRAEYYDRLTAIRVEGDWEGWIRFFLRGVRDVSNAATATARAIVDLRDRHRQIVTEHRQGSTNMLQLLDYLYERPLLTIRSVERHLGCSYVTAASLVDKLHVLGLLRETTGQQRNRVYRYDPYIDLFEPALYGKAAPDANPATLIRTASDERAADAMDEQ